MVGLVFKQTSSNFLFLIVYFFIYIIDCYNIVHIIQLFRQDFKEDVWLSILSNSSNAFADSDTKSNNKKPSKHTTECFAIKTDQGIQCHHDNIIQRYESNPPKSIVIVVTLSPTINQVKYYIIFILY